MRIAIATLLLPLLGCGSTQRTSNASPSEVAVRFATSADNTLTLWRTTPTGIAPERQLDFPDPIVDIGWLDADTPVVMFEDQRVARVVDGALVPFPQAPASAWVASRPTGPDLDADALQPGSSPGELFTFKGEVWIMRCLWEFPYDGGICETIRWVRIHPSFVQQDEAPTLPPIGNLPTVTAPERFVIAPVPVPAQGDEFEATQTVRCAPKGAPASEGHLPLIAQGELDDDFTDMFDAKDPRWLRASPPRFMVTALVPGMEAYEATVLVEGCPATAARVVNEHRVGPAGVWAWTDYADGWQVEGAASVPPPIAAARLEFAPTR